LASIGHIAVGMAAARAYQRERPAPRASAASMLAWAALSFLPDADVIGFGFGVSYGAAWGHRGATHSLFFAVIVGVIAGAAARLFHQSPWRTGIVATVIVASHPLLDTLTNGGLGCALFWPFDTTRYFAPWRPIPVSPIGLGYLSPYGMFVAVSELVIFSPFLWAALRSENSEANKEHELSTRNPEP
jgi:inner membrane protein